MSSSSSRSNSRRNSRRAFLGLMAASPLMLSGCGFRSALSDRPGVQGTESSLTLMRSLYVRQTDYAKDSDIRMAQDLRNALVNRVGSAGQPAFALRMQLNRRIEGAGLTIDNRWTRMTIHGRVDFVLEAINQEGKAPPRAIYNATETAWSSYDRMDSPFSDRIAERELDSRVARQLADQIFNRLVGWFSRVNQGAVPN